MYYSNEQKQEIYKRWLENGRPWFALDKSKEPSYTEKQVIMEMKQEEKIKENRDKLIEENANKFRELYGKKGILTDKVFDSFLKY